MSVLDLPLDATPHPRRLPLSLVRSPGRWLLRQRWPITVTGADLVPSTGPVVLAGNHLGLLDGPMLTVCTPRPVHALVKQEMYAGRLGPVLRAAGQIPLDRFVVDPGAVKTTLRVLRDGGAIGIFPEGRRGPGDLGRFHHGAAYLALVSGAPVVPVTFLGTRAPGGHIESLPPAGTPLDLVFGEPWRVERQPWPRRREQVLHASALLLQHMRAAQERALAVTGQTLPGPLPADERELDPPTGFAQRGAS